MTNYEKISRKILRKMKKTIFHFTHKSAVERVELQSRNLMTNQKFHQ